VSELKADLSDLILKFKKDFGDNSLVTLDSKPTECQFIPTGILSIDNVLGIGGIPRGKISEIYGPEASGKSSLCLRLIANAQKMGLNTVYIDMEHALNPALAELIGVDMSQLLFAQPDSGEQALSMTRKAAESGVVDLIVVDSVAALSTRQEINGEIGDASVGGLARLMSQSLKLLSPLTSNHGVTIVFVNQVRMKIGVMFGNPETTTGGRALPFYASVRLEMTPSTAIKDGDEVVGRTIKAKVVKNKVAPPFKNASFEVIYGQDTIEYSDTLALASEAGIVVKSGAWYSYDDMRIGQGKNNAIDWLIQNKEHYQKIVEKVRGHYGIPDPFTEFNLKKSRADKNKNK
jgi:recombination protein RecA